MDYPIINLINMKTTKIYFTYMLDHLACIIHKAIKREHQIKSYNRAKKDKLIDEINSQWKELKAPISKFSL